MAGDNETSPVAAANPERRFTTTYLRGIRYGPDSVESLWDVIQDADILPGQLHSRKPKALVITGKSLSKTPVIPRIEQLLKDRDAYTTTFTGIGEHAPKKDTEEALRIFKEQDANIVVGVGGGSVIDACKLLSFFHHERRGTFIPHVAIPTTLSAAEFTSTAGYTDEEGNKKSAKLEEICPKAILLDPKLTIYTPERLWLSTGLRAMDHAIETLYRPGAPYPLQQMALAAIRDLFTYLPLCVGEGQNNIDARGKLQIAAWMSLFPSKLETGLGPSHALGHALGATYGIPHGICSVLTLPNTVRMMARLLPSQDARAMLANSFSYLPTPYVRDHMHLHGELDDDHADTSTCLAIAAALDKLIEKLNLKSTLSQYKVPKADLVKIAEKAYSATVAGPGWKALCPSADDMVKHVLEPIY